MSAGITGKVVGAEQVQARLVFAGEKSRGRILDAVAAGTFEVEEAAKRRLSGEVLNVRSGRLRRSVNSKTVDNGDTIAGSVGTTVTYGRFWELGFHGSEQVKEHTRIMRFATVDGRLKTQGDLIHGPATKAQSKLLVFAKADSFTKTGKGRYGKNHSATKVTVKAHTRRVDVEPRPFLQPSLEEKRPAVRARLLAAVTGGLNGS